MNELHDKKTLIIKQINPMPVKAGENVPAWPKMSAMDAAGRWCQWASLPPFCLCSSYRVQVDIFLEGNVLSNIFYYLLNIRIIHLEFFFIRVKTNSNYRILTSTPTVVWTLFRFLKKIINWNFECNSECKWISAANYVIYFTLLYFTSFNFYVIT